MSLTLKAAIQALKSRIADAYTAISQKGGTLPATQDSANLPTAIASIPSGDSPYSNLTQLGFSQSFIDEITNLEKPTAEDIAASAPYMNRSSTGYRFWQGEAFRWLKYIPSFTITDGDGKQTFFEDLNAIIVGEIKTTIPLTTMLNFTNVIFSDSPFPVMYIDGDEIDATNATTLQQAFGWCNVLRRMPRLKVGSSCTNMYRTFDSCYSLPYLDFSKIDSSNVTTFYNCFYRCAKLERIDGVIDLSSATSVSTMFYQCYSLKEVRIKNVGISLSLSGSKYLSYDSLLYLVQNVQNVSGQTLTLSSTNLAKLNATAEGQAAIATAQSYGWTIA